MAKRFIDNVIEFLDTIYNIQGSTIIVPKMKRMVVDRRFKNVIPYLVVRKFIKITYKDGKNKDYSPKNISHVHLRDSGMEFLTDHKNREAQKEFNRMIALTGCVIALISIYGFLKPFLGSGSGEIYFNSVFLFLVIVCFIPIIIFIINSYRY